MISLRSSITSCLPFFTLVGRDWGGIICLPFFTLVDRDWGGKENVYTRPSLISVSEASMTRTGNPFRPLRVAL
jgi:hypothetical protein